MRCLLEKFTQPENFFTTAGRDGRDKFQVCSERLLQVDSVSLAHYRYLYIWFDTQVQLWDKQACLIAFFTWICQKLYMDFSKLWSGFVKVATWIR